MHSTKQIIRRLVQLSIIISFIMYHPVTIISASEPISQDSSGYSETEDIIYSTLREHGYSHAGACGILGNMSVENPKFEPDLEANHGLTYGLFQWTNDGGRRSNLVTFCNNRSLYYNRLEGQMTFALYELEGGDPIAKRCNEYLLHADDAGMAAMEFAVGFERCIGESLNPEADGIYTGSIYPEFDGMTYQALSERIKRAGEYEMGYRDFAGIIDKEILLEIEPDESLVRTPFKLGLFGVLSVIIGYCIGCLYYNKLIKGDLQLSNFTSIRRLSSGRDEATESAVLNVLLGILFDIVKAYLAMLICYLLFGKILREELIPLSGLGVLLGNNFPIWNKGKGGYGTAVTLLLITTYLPIWGLLCIAIWAVTVRLSHSLHIGTLVCSVAAIPFAFVTKGVPGGILVTVIALAAALKRVMIIYRVKADS